MLLVCLDYIGSKTFPKFKIRAMNNFTSNYIPGTFFTNLSLDGLKFSNIIFEVLLIQTNGSVDLLHCKRAWSQIQSILFFISQAWTWDLFLFSLTFSGEQCLRPLGHPKSIKYLSTLVWEIILKHLRRFVAASASARKAPRKFLSKGNLLLDKHVLFCSRSFAASLRWMRSPSC